MSPDRHRGQARIGRSASSWRASTSAVVLDAHLGRHGHRADDRHGAHHAEVIFLLLPLEDGVAHLVVEPNAHRVVPVDHLDHLEGEDDLTPAFQRSVETPEVVGPPHEQHPPIGIVYRYDGYDIVDPLVGLVGDVDVQWVAGQHVLVLIAPRMTETNGRDPATIVAGWGGLLGHRFALSLGGPG